MWAKTDYNQVRDMSGMWAKTDYNRFRDELSQKNI